MKEKTAQGPVSTIHQSNMQIWKWFNRQPALPPAPHFVCVSACMSVCALCSAWCLCKPHLFNCKIKDHNCCASLSCHVYSNKLHHYHQLELHHSMSDLRGHKVTHTHTKTHTHIVITTKTAKPSLVPRCDSLPLSLPTIFPSSYHHPPPLLQMVSFPNTLITHHPDEWSYIIPNVANNPVGKRLSRHLWERERDREKHKERERAGEMRYGGVKLVLSELGCVSRRAKRMHRFSWDHEYMERSSGQSLDSRCWEVLGLSP